MERLAEGGGGALLLLIEVGKQMHDRGGEMALKDWVRVALPMLPEPDRAELVSMLMGKLLETFEVEVESGEP
jgi:hypothetical protein